MIRPIIVIAALVAAAVLAFPAHGQKPNPTPPLGPFTIDKMTVCIRHGGSPPVCENYAIKERSRDIFKTLAECQKTGRTDSIILARSLALKHFPGKRGVVWVSSVPCRKLAKGAALGV